MSTPEGAQLLHRGAQLAARARVVLAATSTPGDASAASPRRTTRPTRSTSASPSGCAAGPRRQADLHRPRPDRADRRPLGPQLREAAREGRPAGDADAPEHLLRDAQPVPHAARSVPRALRRASRSSSSSSATCATTAHVDAAPGLRVRRRRPGLRAPEVRAGAPLDLAQEARDAARPRVQRTASRTRGGRRSRAGLAGARRRAAAFEADRAPRTSPRRSARRGRSRCCTRTPTGCGTRPGATSRTGRSGSE